METKKKKREGQKSRGISAGAVVVCCFIIALLIFNYVFGSPSNFVNGDPKNSVLPGNLLGTVYKGGIIVPVVMTLFLTVLTLSIERWFAIGRAKGKGNLVNFVYDIKNELTKGDLKAAEDLCAKQKGAVAAVIDAGLKKYAEMQTTTENLSKEQKLASIQQKIEEATALELPSMEQNLPVVATISTLGTLCGLLGTVLGMIRAFAALANAGAPDSIALSTAISEALVNTAIGILSAACAVISYNFYTSKIDNITYAIDEMGFSIVQTYASTHK